MVLRLFLVYVADDLFTEVFEKMTIYSNVVSYSRYQVDCFTSPWACFIKLHSLTSFWTTNQYVLCHLVHSVESEGFVLEERVRRRRLA